MTIYIYIYSFCMNRASVFGVVLYTTRMQIYTGTLSTDNDDFKNERIHFFLKI